MAAMLGDTGHEGAGPFRATIPPVISAGQLAALRARGLRIGENVVQPGQRTPLTFRADLDVLAHRLRGLDLSQADHVQGRKGEGGGERLVVLTT